MRNRNQFQPASSQPLLCGCTMVLCLQCSLLRTLCVFVTLCVLYTVLVVGRHTSSSSIFHYFVYVMLQVNDACIRHSQSMVLAINTRVKGDRVLPTAESMVDSQ